MCGTVARAMPAMTEEMSADLNRLTAANRAAGMGPWEMPAIKHFGNRAMRPDTFRSTHVMNNT